MGEAAKIFASRDDLAHRGQEEEAAGEENVDCIARGKETRREQPEETLRKCGQHRKCSVTSAAQM